MIDWKMVALNIRQSGVSLSRAADLIGCDEQTINRLSRGDTKEPKFSIGVKILDLHFDFCKEKHGGIKL